MKISIEYTLGLFIFFIKGQGESTYNVDTLEFREILYVFNMINRLEFPL